MSVSFILLIIPLNFLLFHPLSILAHHVCFSPHVSCLLLLSLSLSLSAVFHVCLSAAPWWCSVGTRAGQSSEQAAVAAVVALPVCVQLRRLRAVGAECVCVQQQLCHAVPARQR